MKGGVYRMLTHFLATLFLRSAKEKELANAQTAFSF